MCSMAIFFICEKGSGMKGEPEKAEQTSAGQLKECYCWIISKSPPLETEAFRRFKKKSQLPQLSVILIAVHFFHSSDWHICQQSHSCLTFSPPRSLAETAFWYLLALRLNKLQERVNTNKILSFSCFLNESGRFSVARSDPLQQWFEC